MVLYGKSFILANMTGTKCLFIRIHLDPVSCFVKVLSNSTLCGFANPQCMLCLSNFALEPGLWLKLRITYIESMAIVTPNVIMK